MLLFHHSAKVGIPTRKGKKEYDYVLTYGNNTFINGILGYRTWYKNKCAPPATNKIFAVCGSEHIGSGLNEYPGTREPGYTVPGRDGGGPILVMLRYA